MLAAAWGERGFQWCPNKDNIIMPYGIVIRLGKRRRETRPPRQDESQRGSFKSRPLLFCEGMNGWGG